MPTTLEKQRLNLDCEGRRDDVWLAVCAHRCETHHGYFHQTLARLCAVERGHEHGLPADRVISPRMEYLSTTAASGGIHLHVENHGVIGSQAETDRWLQTSVERLKRRNKL